MPRQGSCAIRVRASVSVSTFPGIAFATPVPIVGQFAGYLAIPALPANNRIDFVKRRSLDRTGQPRTELSWSCGRHLVLVPPCTDGGVRSAPGCLPFLSEPYRGHAERRKAAPRDRPVQAPIEAKTSR